MGFIFVNVSQSLCCEVALSNLILYCVAVSVILTCTKNIHYESYDLI